MEKARRALGALFVLLSLPAALAAAPSPPVLQLDAASQGEIVDAPGTDARAEILTFGEELAPSLLQVAPEATVRIAGWPVAPGERTDVRLTRFEIYAPDARIWKVEGDRRTEVPRSRMAFFRGPAEDDPDTQVFVAVDPDTRRFQGLAISPQGTHEIRPLGDRRHLVTVPEYFLPEGEDGKLQALSSQCGQSETEEHLDLEAPAPSTSAGGSGEPLFEAVLPSLHTATIAVDTDNELMLQKFSNNTTNASNYVAALIAAMNVIYERDLKIRLLQGTTFLRVSTTADPYAQTGNGASSAQLQEFSNYWSATYGSVQRSLAMMLSGKSTNANSSSGIAWVTGLCSTSTGYSFSQVFKFAGSTGSTDAFVVGHELGHNFGSPHTHCYNPPIDTCYTNGGTGCYVGPTSCPAATTINGVANVRGTLMSYCHLLGGCAAANVFHPVTVDRITAAIVPKINVCIFPAGSPGTQPVITTINPASGKTTGGTVVTITGSGFQSGATVSFGGTAGTAVTVQSATQLRVTAPAHAAGAVSVVVTNPGGLNATRNPGFFYAAPPAATDLYTVAPCRVLDTRNATGAWGGPALGPSAQRTFTLTGRCGIPSNAAAVVANVTAFQPTGPGTLSVFPGDAFDLGTMVLGFNPGNVLAGSSILRLSTNGTGTIGIRNNATGTTHVILDVTGYYR